MRQHRHVAPAPAGTAGRRGLGRYGWRASIGLGVVGLVAGLMFSTSATIADDAFGRTPDNFTDLVRLEAERLAATNEEVRSLRQEVAALLEEQADPASADAALEFASGTSPVTGPGLVVRLWDAPATAPTPDWATGDDRVVHQQDLEAVMNGLWAGGAEAMTVQGHRVTMTSSVRCVGNVLLIDGATYSPPYEIAAIGDPTALESALLASEQIIYYLQYVEALNLGWSVEAAEEIPMPADDSNLTMEYADVPG